MDAIGKEFFKKKNLIIGILARDCDKYLKQNIDRIENLRGYFNSSHVSIVENDSIDNTKIILKNWAFNSANIHLDSFNEKSDSSIKIESKGLYRINKMIKYRNRLLSNICKLPSSDYVIFIDIDICSFRFEGILLAIMNAPLNWNALFANGTLSIKLNANIIKKVKLQYDTYAYLEKIENNYIDKKRYAWYNQILLASNMQKRIDKYLYSPCISAFGGIGIYRYNSIINNKYSTIQINENLAICEHIPFNIDAIGEGNQNYICRYVEVNYGVINMNKITVLLFYLFPKSYLISSKKLKQFINYLKFIK